MNNASEYMNSLLSEDRWLIKEDGFTANRTLSYESIFSLANGYMGTRGALEEGNRYSLPTSFINGVFDKSETFMRELANLPNWLTLKFNVEKDEINIEDNKLLSFQRVLDMKKAILLRSCVIEDGHGRQTRLETIRFLSRAHVHRMAIEARITPLNYSGIIEVQNILDGSVVNFKDAPRFKVKHITISTNETLEKNDGVYLEWFTRDNHLYGSCGSVIEMEGLGNRAFNAFGEESSEFKDFKVEEGKTYVLHKYSSFYTEREVKKEKLKSAVRNELKAFKKNGFAKELEEHVAYYEKMWDIANIDIKGDDVLDNAIRFCIFQLMSTGNEHDNKVNVGAKLLSGEEYGGHAFWDTELFMLPFFTYEFPKTARNLEDYRYHLLDAARANAKKTGYEGARYPWESADDGTEQCPDWTIYPDGSAEPCFVAKYEQHVTSAIAYGILEYVSVTGDYEYLKTKGLEILIETARFWASRCEYNKKKDRYEINQVTGPDEWHEPVNNNLYTNYLARWNLCKVIEMLNRYKEEDVALYQHIKRKLKLKESEFVKWQDCIDKIYLPKKKGTRLMEQFEGYFKLKDVTITEYDENDWPKRPKALTGIDRSTTTIIKQADVVMLLHLLNGEFDEETVKENYHYYEARTLHGSSLSPSIYSVMGLKVGDASKAYRYLKRAATLDLLDLQHNGREGLHAANTGGVWQTVVFGFMGVEAKNGVLSISPKKPEQWSEVSFKINYQGRLLKIEVGDDVKVERLKGEPLEVVVLGNTLTV